MEPKALFGDQDQGIVFYNGNTVSRAEFWSHVQSFRKTIPDAPYVINDCKNRYAFLVVFVACLINKQISLFPSNRTEHLFQKLKSDFPGVYCVTDQELSLSQIKTITIDIETLQHDKNHSTVKINPELTALIAFTSGTTGEPEPYYKTWGGFLHEARVAGESLGLDVNEVKRCVATIPAQHMYGFIASIMVPLYYGIAIEADCPFYPEDIRLNLLSVDTDAMLVTTPIQLRNCVLENTELDNLAFILSSAASLEESTARQAESDYDVPVYEFYGSTETGAIAFRKTTKDSIWKTFNDITVSESGGKLLVSAPYLNDSQTINDYVSVLTDREFTFKSRSSDVIKISGKRASLNELNMALMDVPNVKDGTFYQLDSGHEQRLIAFIVSNKPSHKFVLEELKTRIDPVFLPRRINFVESLPRSETGKLTRDAISLLVNSTK